jgi:hypothetical protein
MDLGVDMSVEWEMAEKLMGEVNGPRMDARVQARLARVLPKGP